MSPLPPHLDIVPQHNAEGVITGYSLPSRQAQVEAYNALRDYMIEQLSITTKNDVEASPTPPSEAVEGSPDDGDWPQDSGHQLSNQVSPEAHGKWKLIIWDESSLTMLAGRELAERVRQFIQHYRNL